MFIDIIVMEINKNFENENSIKIVNTMEYFLAFFGHCFVACVSVTAVYVLLP